MAIVDTCTLPKNWRHGRLTLKSGDGTALSKVVAFANASFSVSQPKNIIVKKNRGVIAGVRRGDEEPAEISFEAEFADLQILKILRDFVWPGQTEEITGLTAEQNNAASVSYPYEQGTLLVTDSGWSKLANDATPSGDNEYAEAAGTADIEGVTVVPASASSSFYPPAATTSVNVSYDAVGASTGSATCDDVKQLTLVYELLDPTDLSTAKHTFTFAKCVPINPQFSEGEDANTLSVTLQNIESRYTLA